MEINAILCDHAEAAENKLFVNGGAINLFFTGPEPPHIVSASVAAVLHVPYTATNQPHRVNVTMQTHDGQPIKSWTPEGIQETPVQIEGTFNLGRPPHLSPGEEQTVPLCFNFQVGLAELGQYVFTVDIDGTEMRRLPFRVTVMQP